MEINRSMSRILCSRVVIRSGNAFHDSKIASVLTATFDPSKKSVK